MTTDTLTILRARGRRLAKLIAADGTIHGYDRAKTFDISTRSVANLADLGDVLADLLHRPDCAVVRGEPTGPVRKVRRLLAADPATGELPTLRDAPRRWAALDVEGIALPPAVPAADLAACAHLALASLPPVFAEAGCIVQASGSHGFLPDLRLRLWFWCDRPMGGAELKRWLRDTPADLCVFSAAQLIYTAAPVLAAARDPLPVRLASLPGAAELRCPSPAALVPRQMRAAGHVTVTSKTATAYAAKALRGAVVRILGAEKRHPTILAEARGLARLVRAGMLAESDMRNALHAAAADRDKSRDEVDSILAWAMANPSNAAVPEMRHG